MRGNIRWVATVGVLVAALLAAPVALAEPAPGTGGAQNNWGWIGTGSAEILISPSPEFAYRPFQVTVQQSPMQHITLHLVGTQNQFVVLGQFFYTDPGRSVLYDETYNDFFGPWDDKYTPAVAIGELTLPAGNLNPPNPTDHEVTVYYRLYGKMTGPY